MKIIDILQRLIIEQSQYEFVKSIIDASSDETKKNFNHIEVKPPEVEPIKVSPATQDATATKYSEIDKSKNLFNRTKQTETFLSNQIQNALHNLSSLGYPKEEAAAIVANMKFESSLNPGSLNKNDKGATSYGLIQWRGHDVKYENNKFITKPSKKPSRLKKLLQKDGYNTMSTQIKFLHDELTTDPYESSQYSKVKTGKNAYEMGKLFDKYIERSSGEHREKRGQYAEKIFKDIESGHYQYT